MRLTDLQPRWLEYAGRRIAMMFRCPHCFNQQDEPVWLTCFFECAGDLPKVSDDDPVEELRGWRGERKLFYLALKDMGHPDPLEGTFKDVVDCRADIAWHRTGDDFANMSITPSIDAGASGHWHGFILNGAIA